MATTAPGSPYVESSDLVANYPAVSEALAERVDTVGVLPFATSTARGTALPSPTEGQYTYLQDTNATEYWDGAAWVAAGVAPGLVHIATETFSAVSSVSMSNKLVASCNNYLIIWALTNTTDSRLRLRLRLDSTDATSANYDQQQNLGADTSTNFSSAANETSSLLSQTRGSGSNGHCLMSNANLASYTFFTSRGGHSGQFGDSSGIHDVATAYNGITIFPATGAMTGTIRLYGYAND